MEETPNLRKRFGHSSKVAILAALIIGGVLMLAVLGTQVFTELRKLRSASTDNVQWNLSQLEVDLLVFNLALERAQFEDTGEPALADVRQRFDVFYSRFNIISRGETYSQLRNAPTTAASVSEIERFIAETATIVDGPDAALRAELDTLADRVADLRYTARTVAINGIAIFAEQSTSQRTLLSNLLKETSLLSGAMLLALLAVLLILFRQIAITEREGSKRQQMNQRLKSTIGASLDAIIVADSEGIILDYNGAAKEVFGYTREFAIGKPLGDLIIPERLRQQHDAGMKRFAETGEKRVVDSGLVELVARHQDGHEFPVEVSIASSNSQKGAIFVSFIRDISNRLRIQQELTEARDDALAADKAKSNFLAVMSHEMRTPLNGLMGTLDLLSGTKLDKKQEQYVDVAKRSGTLLLRHINDVLDISKVEARKLVLKEDVLEPARIVRDVADVNGPLARSRGNEIEIRNRLPADFRIMGDSFRLEQTLVNLVGNAVKFTSNGNIVIETFESRSEDGESMIEFRVIDNGIGIAGEDLGRVFDDFVTIDSSYSRRAEGTGLGLGICRRMTEAMGGEIGVESSLGIGSKFWIRIPSRKEEADQRASATHLDIKAVQTASAATQTPLSILVVEDNQINRFVAREFLESMGHEVHEAHDGLEGVSIAEQYRFDAILMDISMPVLDGVGATERIRTGEGKSAGAAIIGLTAHALPEEQARFRQAGMEMCLPKPISREKLGLALSTIMPGQVQAGQTAALGAAEPSILNGYIDTQVVGDLRDMLGPERFRKMFGKFREEVDGTLFRIVVPGDAKSFDDARKLVHKLSGSAGTFGASRLQARLSAIESSCKSQDAALFARNLDGLDDIWRRSVEDFESLH